MASKKKEEYTEIVSETANGEIRIPVKFNLGHMSKLTSRHNSLENVYIIVWQRNEYILEIITRYINALLKDKSITITGDTKAPGVTGEAIAYNLVAKEVEGLAGYLAEEIKAFNPEAYKHIEKRYEEFWEVVEEKKKQRFHAATEKGYEEEDEEEGEEEDEEEDTPNPN